MAPKKRSSPLSTHTQHHTSTSRQYLDHNTHSIPTAHQHPIELPEPTRPRQPRDAHQPVTSSLFHPSFQATPVDPALQPQLPITGSPVPSSEGTAPDSTSRRQSTSSTMRTSSLPLEGPPTSTPTGRISKAKKGKRVHACSYEGCGKVFTRAEHKRRHELNHNPEAMFNCNRPGCRKTFHRLDLLQRHQERHELEHQLESQTAQGHHINHLPSQNELPGSMPPSSLASPQPGGAGRASAGMSIGSLVHPPSHGFDRSHLGTPALPVYNSFRPGVTYVNGFSTTDDSTFWTPESSQSPVSDHYGRHNPTRQSISSSSSVTYDTVQTSPMVNGANIWVPSSAPPNILPNNMFDDQTYVTSNAEPSVPIPLTNLDGDEFEYIRRELSNAPGIISTSPGSDLPNGIRRDAIRWDCLEHYWQHFDPYFPIVHRSTFLPTKPSPLLASAMVAIGSQFDDREDAKQYSMILLELATRLMRRRDTITSRSRLADLQTVFLLEILSKYCARRIEVDMSARFRQLFASLDQAKRTLGTSSLAVFRTLKANPTKEELSKAHKFWVDHETRRRIFQAFCVIDTQQTILFEQVPTIVHHTQPRLSTGPLKLIMSLPCAEELWNVSPIEEWKDMANIHQHLEQTNLDLCRNSGGERQLDYFQAHTWLQSDQSALQQFCFEPDSTFSSFIREGPARDSVSFNKHAFTMAKHTPLRALVIVSGESWVFGKKLEHETEFQECKQKLRAWVNIGSDSLVAFWHALKIIRGQFVSLFNDNNTADIDNPFEPTTMLHQPWTVYIAALICWAHGLYPSLSYNIAAHQRSRAASVVSTSASHHSQSSHASGHPPVLDSAEAPYNARMYLAALDVATPNDLAQVDPYMMGNFHGLLELIRTHKIQPLLGGLMNEAERVLYRLVEGKSSLSQF